jgi:hypothetical protein
VDAYNKARRSRGLVPLTLVEYQDRCGWMETYRDTEDAAERALVVSYLKAQDQPPRGRFDPPPEKFVGMPEWLRERIERAFGPSRVGDAPTRGV